MTAVQSQRILVLGSGTLGEAVLRSLIDHPGRKTTGASITIASRNPHETAKQFQTGNEATVDTLSIDLKDAEIGVLAELFSRFTTVIGCSGMYLPPGSQLKLARAATKSSAKRYFPWQFGVDYDEIAGATKQDLFAEQLQVRQELRSQSHLQWVIVSTGVFSDFLVGPEAGFGVVEKESGSDKDPSTTQGLVVRALGSWQNRVTSTHVEDIGKSVSELVFVDPASTGVILIAGQTVSYAEIAESVKRIMNDDRSAGTARIPVRKEEWTVDYLHDELEKSPENGLLKYRCAFAEGRGVAWDEDKTWNKQRGLQLSRLDDWVRSILRKAYNKS